MTLIDPYTPGFKVTPFFDAKYLIIQTQFQWNINRYLHTPYSTVSFRMTLSDLAKYSMNRTHGLSATAELLVILFGQ